MGKKIRLIHEGKTLIESDGDPMPSGYFVSPGFLDMLFSENQELMDQLETACKSAVFWEREYNWEKKKKWYHKLFGK